MFVPNILNKFFNRFAPGMGCYKHLGIHCIFDGHAVSLDEKAIYFF